MLITNGLQRSLSCFIWVKKIKLEGQDILFLIIVNQFFIKKYIYVCRVKNIKNAGIKFLYLICFF
jgi:hypothetical protein